MDVRGVAIALSLGFVGSGCYAGAEALGPLGDAATTDEATDDGGEDELPESCDGSPAAAPMRRLTAAEYRYTVLDLLEIDALEVVSAFPADPRIDGFANNAAAQTIGLAHATAYQSAAEWVADRVLEAPPASLGCEPSSATCVEAFIEERVPLMWRRPLSPTERERLLALSATASDGPEGLALVIRAVLQSPHFLWRPEAIDEARTGFEIAARLSYFLWQSAPDAQLHEDAAAGRLDSAEGVAEVARRMWSDERAARGRAGFAAGWLRSDRLESVVRSPAQYPEWTPDLRAAMADDLVSMVERFATADDFLDVFVSPTLPMSELTAPLYGVSLSSGPAEVELDEPWRGGVLSTAAVLAATSPGDVTSPVARGVWIREAILCEPLPPPPPDVEVEPPGEDGEDKVARLEAHRRDPACEGCHSLVDPIGLGLERYDALGRLRDVDELGHPPTTTGTVVGLPDSEFQGARQLGEHLRDAPQTRACLATQMFRWAHGRSETAQDDCRIDAATEAFARSGRLEDLAVAIVDPGMP